MSRMDALRALLAQHTPTPDDARIGHRYVYPAPSPTLRMAARGEDWTWKGWGWHPERGLGPLTAEECRTAWEELPADAATVLRENLFPLYWSAPQRERTA